MTNNVYCSMIHSGLWLNFVDHAYDSKVGYRFCCLNFGDDQLCSLDVEDFWNNEYLTTNRKNNLQGQWEKYCVYSCQVLEKDGISFRTSSNEVFGVGSPSGPKRLDIKLSSNCNLACQTCDDISSTFWYKQLKDNNLPTKSRPARFTNEQVFSFMDKIDLSALEQLVFCGGETLLGNTCFDFLEYLKKRRPDKNLQVSFQTNGTIYPNQKQLDLLSEFRLVKLHISLDGIENRFNYLRWPANWNKTTDNMFKLRENIGVNTMFLIEETFSIFNFYYKDECKNWVANNFAENRLGDKVDYSRHFANGIFSLKNMSDEYIDNLDDNFKDYFRNNRNSPDQIKTMIETINRYDKIRGHSWATVFPEVHGFYKSFGA